MNEERCKRLEERQAALEQRVGAAIDVAIATLRDEIGVEDALDRLAALRSPGGVIPSEPVDVAEMQAQIHEADMDRIAAALSTWQAERLANEALAGGPPPPHDCGDGPVNDEPGATTWRGLVDAKEAEIAGLKAKLAEAERAVDETLKERDDLHDLLDEFAACVASEDVIGEHTNANNPWRNAMAMVDTLRARIAELEARDREGRWLVERSNHRQVGKSASDKQRAEMDDYSRRADAYLSGTPPADPARGLIERLVAAYDGCSRRGTIEECSAQERAVYDAIRDLRAHLGGGT